jgi:hypothetical protein
MENEDEKLSEALEEVSLLTQPPPDVTIQRY